MTTIANTTEQTGLNVQKDQNFSALRFITCGSVDDGKSTLIGRLLVDSRSVLQDQVAGVAKGGEVDLAQLTDGLASEREQGITIDVAWRYFATDRRKFIIGDAPGHEQYTRNMVTAASQADAAIVLVDATKLDWANPALQLLPQTRRHSLLVQLLRVPGLAVTATVPISALLGWNVVPPHAGWCGYQGPSLLQLLESQPTTPADTHLPLAFPVQWVEKFSASSDTSQGRRGFWGRVAEGQVQPGQPVQIFPSGQLASVAQVLNHTRQPQTVAAGLSAGVVLDREVDVSRGDWIVAAPQAAAVAEDDFDTPAAISPWPAQKTATATVAWMGDEPLVVGGVYCAMHGHRWVKAKVQHVLFNLDVHTLERQEASQLAPNAIGQVQLLLQEPLPLASFAQARVLGSLILVDTASHKTAGAVLVQ